MRRKNKAVAISLFAAAVCFITFVYAQEQPGNNTAQESSQEPLLNLDLKDVDLKPALKVISQASGMNIVIDKDVSATVNVSIKDVTWETALESILRANQLTYRIQDNIIRIMTPATIQKEQETLPLETRIITLNFAKTDALKTSLAKMLSPRGSIEVNVATNALIVSDTPEAVAEVENLCRKLDVRIPQVMIEAFIMSIKLSETDKFGIDWIATRKDFETATTIEGKRQFTQSLKASSSALDIFYGKTILPKWYFTSQITLYAQDKKVKILANPRIMTMDNLQAQIEITEQVPYTYTSTSTDSTNTLTSTQFKDVGIKLYVTPHITRDNFISLSVKTEQSFVASFVGSTNEPSVDSRKVDTNMMLKDGETVVIGGLRKKENTTTIDKIPILGDLPFIGKAFRKEIKDTTDTELVIFITPHIIGENSMSKEEEERFRKFVDDLSPESKDRQKTIDKNLAEQKYHQELKSLQGSITFPEKISK